MGRPCMLSGRHGKIGVGSRSHAIHLLLTRWMCGGCLVVGEMLYDIVPCGHVSIVRRLW